MKKMNSKICLVAVIPTYNEAGTIVQVLSETLQHVSYVVVVDDGSPDGTGVLVEEMACGRDNVILIKRGWKMGLGSAYKTGFVEALRLRADVIVTMDADGSHPPHMIPSLVSKVLEGYCVAVASRYVEGGRWAAGFVRMLVSRGANMLARISTGIGLRDLTSGFRAYDAKAVEKIINEEFQTGYIYQVDILYKLRKFGCRFVEIPFVFGHRIAGRSKLSWKEVISFAKWCFKTLLRRIGGE